MVLRKGVFPYLLLLIITVAGCKSSDQTSTTYKAYHDLTARYNRYFNAKMIFMETFKQIEEQHEEDYSEILPLYLYHDLESPQTYYPQMDKVVKKESANLQLHPNSKWSDDAYLHIGMAHYVKEGYEQALKAFTSITSKVPTGVRRKPSKSDKDRTRGQPDDFNPYYEGTTSFLKHKPARYEAILWIVRTFTQLEKYSEAQSVMAMAKGDKTFPEDLKDELYKTMTFFHMKRGEYLKAAEAIKRCIEYTDDKDLKRRYFFIQAQLHEKTKNYSLAIQYYRQVLEMQPNYEMEFEAKISIAELSRLENKYSNEYVINLLNDMLKNEHYEDFKGKIYYTLAELYLSENLEQKAIENFRLCVQHSQGNDDQKAAAYKQLADFYFVDENYVPAKNYYDSTLAFFDQEDPKYDTINSRRNTLSDIVEQINIINRQDSLLQLADMSKAEIEAMKKARQKAKKQKEAREEEPQEESFEPLVSNNSNQGSSSWPFDNPGPKSRGYNNFKQQWGERPHIDLWRVKETSNSIPTLPSAQKEESPIASSETEGGDTTTASKTIFDEIPQTQEEANAAENKIIQAYHKLGGLYKEKLDNIDKAIATYEELLDQFPQNEYREETAYRLYLLYQGRDQEKSNHYKNIVLNEYPNGTLAKIIQDPDYLKRQEKQENKVQDYYGFTYKSFKADELEFVLERIEKSDSIYPGNELAPKFDMLKALTYGKMQKYDSMRTELEEIVNKYPFDEIKTKAVAILNSMEGRAYSSTSSDGGSELFKYEPGTKHFLAILFYTVGDTVQNVQVNLSNYNSEYHSLEKLKITSNLLTNDAQLILVKEFKNAEKAKNYYNEVRYNNEIFGDLPKKKYEVFFISPHNYGVFFREKDVDTYMSFFTQRYLEDK